MIQKTAIAGHVFKYLLLILFISPSAFAQQQDTVSIEQQTRTLINLLDYIGKDYAKAVTDGRIINDFEFKEMKEFSEDAKSHYRTIARKQNIADTSRVLQTFAKLQAQIEEKAAQSDVAAIANSIRKRVLELDLINIAPLQWPDMTAGRKIYQQKCSSCHGKKGSGEGPASEGLQPPPSNFLNEGMMSASSPFKSYNVIRLGIPETSMRAFDELNDQQVWHVAFYVNSLQFRQGGQDDEISQKKRQQLKDIPLEVFATLSNKQLKEKYVNKEGSDLTLKDFRLYQPSETDIESPVAITTQHLQKALSLYKKGDQDKAAEAALNAYLKGVEPIEKKVRASDPSLVGQLENDMMAVRTLMKQDKSTQEVEAAVQKAEATIQKAKTILDEQDYSFWFVLLMSGSIIMREGLEALLIIIAILSVLRSVEAHHAKKWVHSGWLTAVTLGVISWFFVDWLLNMGMKSIEVMEGVGALFAVFVLTYIGFWLHNKTHAAKWKAFIEDKIKAKLNINNMLGLAVLSFVVVFREAFETVLFLSSLKLELSGANEAGIWTGVGGAAIIVLIIGWVLMRFSRNVPIRQIFKVTSVAISVLAIILTGKGVHAFQESGFVPITGFFFDFRLPLLGIYPTIETLLAQLFMIGVMIGLWNVSNRSAKATA